MPEGVPSTTLAPAADAFGALPPGVEETHISIIFLVGDRALKLKKPIALPFLDWRDREARRAVCHREVELNRRLAPDVYLGVADVVGSDGLPCDHLVVMRRMPEARRLSRLVRDGADVRDGLGEVAAVVAGFHAAAARSPAITAAADLDTVRRNWDDNLAVLRQAAAILDQEQVARLARLADRYLAGRGALYRERAESGCAVDGHGDLLADDIYLLDDGPRILDCIEFSDAFRSVDVLDDIAFLAMDLERLGSPALAEHLLEAYRSRSGESHPDSLLHHFIGYRAGVRSKVACLRARQGLDAAVGEAQRLLDIAVRHLERARVRLVLVGGLPATGKSTLAQGLGERTGWPVLHSDVTRKALAGLPPDAAMGAGYREGLYDPAMTAATYRALLDQARRLLERGSSVVLDASWSDPTWRHEAAAVADATCSELELLRCELPEGLALERLASRTTAWGSDATPEVARCMAADAAPWPEAQVVDTRVPPSSALAAALAILGLGGA